MRERIRGAETGATAVEFAIVFPLVVTFMFALIDGGRLMASRLMLTNAVSAGARVAAMDSTSSTTSVQSAVNAAAPSLTMANFSVTTYSGTTATTKAFTARATGDKIAVHAEYTFSPAFFSSMSRTLQQTSWVVFE